MLLTGLLTSTDGGTSIVSCVQSVCEETAPSAKEGLLKDSSHKTSHCFPRRVLPRKAVECCSDHPLPSLEIVTHKTHKCRQTGAYRTLNKRGHIPGVFPHEVTSCSRGRMGCWEFTGDLPRRTLPPPEDLSALFLFFFSPLCLHYLHLSIHLYLPFSVSLPLD